jgi:chaperonin GroEL (HSP60 family)
MAAKDVRFSTDARDRILRGVEILNNAVKITLGPKGRNVVIEKSYGAPRISKELHRSESIIKHVDLQRGADQRSARAFCHAGREGGNVQYKA